MSIKICNSFVISRKLHAISYLKEVIGKSLWSVHSWFAFGAFFYDLFGERIARHEADVGDLAFTVGVSCDGSVFAPHGMVIVRDYFSCGGRQEPASHVGMA